MTDSCPACVRRAIPPAAERRRGESVVHGYRCPACGYIWATARHLPVYTPPRKSAA